MCPGSPCGRFASPRWTVVDTDHVDGFAVPWLAQALPQVFTTPPTLSLQIGGLLSYVLFALGWVLYGLATLRARAVPVMLSIALIAGGVLGYHSGLPPYGTPIGLTVAALGAWLIHRDRVAGASTDAELAVLER